MHLRTFLGVTFSLSLLGIAACAHDPEVPNDEALITAASQARMIEATSAKEVCEIDESNSADRQIRYIGDTDTPLIACLTRFIATPNATLTITSSGGEVISSIAAANMIHLLGWKVKVLGKCVSSCGNYIAPAAKDLEVLPYSYIALHGGPSKSEDTARAREELREALIRAGTSPENLERNIERNMKNMRLSSEAHEAFIQTYRIKRKWYELDSADLGITQADVTANKVIIADPEMFASCVGKRPAGRFWFPANQSEKLGMVRTPASLQKMIFRSQLGLYDCG
jgi:ATP-dependent protease ClpP protease subunit